MAQKRTISANQPSGMVPPEGEPTYAQLVAKVAELSEQVAGLQDGYLLVVDKMKEIANEVVRLERHQGIGINSIIIPHNWRSMPKVK
jgi:hypothetical protein